jgi:hypothetical protein
MDFLARVLALLLLFWTGVVVLLSLAMVVIGSPTP